MLTGGEYAAMAIADAVRRLCPGVLSDPECYENESHWDGMLEYSQYSPLGYLAWPEGAGHFIVWAPCQHRKVAAQDVHPPYTGTAPDLYQKLDFSSKSDQKLLAELDAEDAEKK